MNEIPDILIKQLETDIEKYDIIFLIDNAHELAVRFCHAKALKDTTDTILILLNNPSMRLADMTLNDNIVLRYVSAEEFFCWIDYTICMIFLISFILFRGKTCMGIFLIWLIVGY